MLMALSFSTVLVVISGRLIPAGGVEGIPAKSNRKDRDVFEVESGLKLMVRFEMCFREVDGSDIVMMVRR